MIAVITDEGAVGRGMRMLEGEGRGRREKNARERRDELIE
jgi:hypothetical protein